MATTEEAPEKRRPGVPKYFYWAKNPPKPAPYQSKAMTHEQRRFRFVVSAFTIAKVLAIIAFFLLIFGRL
ncbi:MAG: hypothetical protein OK441_00530 [Thaumarchaeota archaeon]|nr:hypothetical protein [Nitrososphaerota archaeon]